MSYIDLLICSDTEMSEVETEVDSRYDDIDVESVLERCHRQAPISFSRKTFLYQGL